MSKENIKLPREIRIGTVKSLWETIYKKQSKARNGMEIDMKDVEILDGAGLQLVLYLKNLSREIPEDIQLIKVQNTLKELLATNGCSL